MRNGGSFDESARRSVVASPHFRPSFKIFRVAPGQLFALISVKKIALVPVSVAADGDQLRYRG